MKTAFLPIRITMFSLSRCRKKKPVSIVRICNLKERSRLSFHIEFVSVRGELFLSF